MARITERSIQEIIDKRQRVPTPDVSASWRMSSLIQSFNDSAKHREEVIRYYPIAVVAVLDGYFRARLPSLIDSGDPFRANAVEKYSEVKLNLQLGEALSTRRVSLGELIMNSVGISSFQSLVHILTNITGRPNCLAEIAQVAPKSFDSKARRPFITSPNDAWARLSKVFELRHILCHELAPDLSVDESETRLLLLAAQEFVRASAAWIEDLESPNVRKLIVERSRSQSARLAEAERRTSALLKGVSQLLDSSELEEGEGMKSAVREASSSLESYISSINAIRRYGMPDARPKRRRPKSEGLESKRHADILEPLVEALTELEFSLQLGARYQK